jgi:hypothetical protein
MFTPVLARVSILVRGPMAPCEIAHNQPLSRRSSKLLRLCSRAPYLDPITGEGARGSTYCPYPLSGMENA